MSRAKGYGFILIMGTKTKSRTQSQNTIPRFEIVFGVLFIVLSFIIVLNSKFFAVSNVEIKGNFSISSEDIILNTGLSSCRNIFQLNVRQIKASLLKDLRIASVRIKRQLPDKIIIHIQERVPVCLLSYLNNLLIIGNDCMVMGVQEEAETVELPVVFGAELKGIKYGERIESADFQNVLKILGYSDDYLRQVISEIDLSKLRMTLDLPKYNHQVRVELGNIKELDKKLANLRAILLSPDLNGDLERIDLRVADLPTVITSKSLQK